MAKRDKRSGWGAAAVALDLLFAAAVLVTALAWLLDPLRVRWGPLRLTVGWGFKAPAALAAIVALRWILARAAGRRGAAAGGLWARDLYRIPMILLLTVFGFFLVFEGVLARSGFEAPLPPIVIVDDRGASAPGGARVMLPDPRLLWRFNPGVWFNGRAINSLGFPDREVDPVKKPGTIRVICMGDSCTGQGIPPYSRILNDLLTAHPPTPAPWEAFNTAVHGYSSVQGLELFRTRIRRWAPDVVTVYFGWNDHWLGRKPDRLQMAWGANRPVAALASVLREKRFFQYLMHRLQPDRAVRKTDAPATPGQGPRVPPDDYERTLRQFVGEIRKAGAVPLLITAPRAQAVSRYFVHRQLARSVDELQEAHDAYNDIVRKVAAETGAPMLDLAGIVAREAPPDLFIRDGVHFTQDGLGWIAQRIYDKVAEMAAAGTIPGR